MRPFQWYLRSHWKFPQSLDKSIPVTRNFLNYLKWWEDLQNLMAGAPLHPHVHNTLVFTDASQKGWGAHLNQIVLSGLWSNKEAQLHINVLELKAVLLALKGFQENLQGQSVLICSDNSTVVSYLNKEEGTHSIEMCALIWRILAFTNSRRIQIRARHVPGSLKCDSRLPIKKGQGHTNRVVPSPTDIQPNLQSLAHTIGRPVCNSSKLQTSNLCISCPRQKGLENRCIEYLLGRPRRLCLLSSSHPATKKKKKKKKKKKITYPCRMIVLAPGLPGMPWFWDLVDLSTRVPLQLPHWKTLLKQPHSNRFHNNVEYLNRHVWLLDSRNPILEDSHLRWQKELRHLRGNPQEKSTNQGGPFMGNGAHRIRWTSPQQLFPR